MDYENEEDKQKEIEASKRSAALRLHKLRKKEENSLVNPNAPKEKKQRTASYNYKDNDPETALMGNFDSVFSIEQTKSKIEESALNHLEKEVDNKSIQCPDCFGEKKIKAPKIIDYEPNAKGVMKPVTQIVDTDCPKCWGEGIIHKKNSERYTEMVTNKHFPKVNVNIDASLDKMQTQDLLDFIKSA